MIRKIILLICDALIIYYVMFLALALRFDFVIPSIYLDSLQQYQSIGVVCSLMIFSYLGAYKSLWRHASIDEMLIIIKASFINMIFLYSLFFVMNISLPRSFYINNFTLLILCTGGLRFSYRIITKIKSQYISKSRIVPVLIIGGGTAGSLVIKELFLNPKTGKIPVGIIDDDISKKGRKIHGVAILGTREDILKIAEKKRVQEIIFAAPSINKKEKSEIMKICKQTNCKLKTLPSIYEIIDGKVDIKNIRDVAIEDLLDRDAVNMDLQGISSYIQNEVVLVSGGGGSIGSELCRQILRFYPKKLLILDNYENNVYDLQQELRRKYNDTVNLEVIIASIRDYKRLKQIIKDQKPKIIFHAAAHKHVPLMEENPIEAIKNNVFGTLNIAKISDECKVKKFVLISTDKAVNPTNIMGATKRIAEMIIQMLNNHSETEFVAVRFGNVLGSNGSVIPLFRKQIIEGGPVTITHPEVTRYFMTISEATQLVIQAGAIAQGGEIFVLDMGQPVKIVDLAKDLIKLSGFEPEQDIKIEFTGLRPGEKLYEELFMKEEILSSTRHEKIFVSRPIEIDTHQLTDKLENLRKAVEDEIECKEEELYETIKRMVPTYKKDLV